MHLSYSLWVIVIVTLTLLGLACLMCTFEDLMLLGIELCSAVLCSVPFDGFVCKVNNSRVCMCVCM